MLNLDDLLAANIACRIALLGVHSLRQLLTELDAQAPPGSLIPALHQRGFPVDRLQQLQHAARQRRAQLETQYFLSIVRARGAVDPATLQALATQQARDGYRWSLADVLVNRGFLAAEVCLSLTREAAQLLAQREQQLLHTNRQQGFGPVLETGTSSGRHLPRPTSSSSGSHRLSASSSGQHPNPMASSGYRNASGSGLHRNPMASSGAGFAEIPNTDFDKTLPVDPPDAPIPNTDFNETLPVDPPEPGFDPERTMAFQETLKVPEPPEPTFDEAAQTLMMDTVPQPVPGLGNDPCRTIGFDDVLLAPGAPPDPQFDELDAERTITIPAPGAPEQTINLPPPPVKNPFGTIQATAEPGDDYHDQTITMRPDLGDDAPPEMPPGLERVRELGRGNMGVVYLARQPDQRLVAVKVIKATTKDAAARFKREILVSAKVQHPHVIEVLDSGTLPNGSNYMAMEYLEGRELKELIQSEAPLPLTRSLELLDQLLAALEATHAAEIVHRDLKPENVQVLTRQGGDHIKLVDFGISRILTQQEEEDAEEVFVTMRGTLSGTPMYVAPEAILEPDDVTKGHDVYAAGVILYELLTGALPFDASRTLRDLLKDTVESRPKPLEIAHPGGEFPEPVKRLVARFLEKDPQARPQDGAAARELLRETRDVLAGRAAPRRRRAATTRQPGITARLLRKITGIFRRDTGSV